MRKYQAGSNLLYVSRVRAELEEVRAAWVAKGYHCGAIQSVRDCHIVDGLIRRIPGALFGFAVADVEEKTAPRFIGVSDSLGISEKNPKSVGTFRTLDNEVEFEFVGTKAPTSSRYLVHECRLSVALSLAACEDERGAEVRMGELRKLASSLVAHRQERDIQRARLRDVERWQLEGAFGDSVFGALLDVLQADKYILQDIAAQHEALEAIGGSVRAILQDVNEQYSEIKSRIDALRIDERETIEELSAARLAGDNLRVQFYLQYLKDTRAEMDASRHTCHAIECQAKELLKKHFADERTNERRTAARSRKALQRARGNEKVKSLRRLELDRVGALSRRAEKAGKTEAWTQAQERIEWLKSISDADYEAHLESVRAELDAIDSACEVEETPLAATT